MENERNSYYAYTKTGSLHEKQALANQDAYAHAENEAVKVIALADGVSTRENGGRGAAIACETVMGMLLQAGERLLSMDDALASKLIVERILENIRKAAADVASYACTLAFAVFFKRTGKISVFLLGDTLALIAKEEGYVRMLAPTLQTEETCCVTTEGADSHAAFFHMDVENTDGVMLVTDGAWRTFCREGFVDAQVQAAFCARAYGDLKKYLQDAETPDDSTFIAANCRPKSFAYISKAENE